MALDQKPRYYYTAVVAKLSIFSNLVLRKRILTKRIPVRVKYVSQLSESFDFPFFSWFGMMLSSLSIFYCIP